jgi:hypothetical protein
MVIAVIFGMTLVAVPAGAARIGPGPATPDPVNALATGDRLGISDQLFSIEPDSPWSITLALPAGIDSTSLGIDPNSVTEIVITAHRVLGERQDFDAAEDGQLTRADDSIDVSLEPDALGPTGADPRITRPSPESLALTIATESTDRTPDALQFARAGVHPVVIEIRVNNVVVADTTTYVHRRPRPDEAFGDLSVALVMSPISTPLVDRRADVAVSDVALDEYGRLADALTAFEPDGKRLARSVRVEPEVLRSVMGSDPELGNRLVTLLAGTELVAAPRLPIDPSTAVRNDRTDNYIALLREGEDLLVSLAPDAFVDRSTMLVDAPISGGGAQLRRNLATDLLVLPSEIYFDLEGSTGLLTDTTRLLTVALPDGTSIDGILPDPYFSETLDIDATDDTDRAPGTRIDPYRTAIATVAELLVIATQIDGDGQLVDRHGLILSRSDGGVPDPAMLAPLARLLATTPGLRTVTASEVGRLADPWLVDGLPVTVQLPAQAGIDQTERYAVVDRIFADAVTWATVLPADDPTVTGWFDRIAALPSTAMSSGDAAALVADIDDEFAEISTSIVPPEPFLFTLTGKRQPIRFKMRNNGTTPLTVRIRLESAKIRFPDGDQIETLEPGVDQEIEVDVEALSNGSSSVFLRVFAPDPNRSLEVVPQTVLTARVNSLAGLGQLLTGALLLLIATWWFTNWRRSRARDRAAVNVSRHPSNGGIADESDTDGARDSGSDRTDTSDGDGDGDTVLDEARTGQPRPQSDEPA